MNYKYKKRQIFGKKLKVPKDILNKVYDCFLSFNEFIEYGLDDKIPTSCIKESDRKIVERFGIDKCKELDWELINTKIYNNDIRFKDILIKIDPETEDINHALYEQVKDQIMPSYYSSKMKKVYSDRIFEISQNETYDSKESEMRNLKKSFNDGKVSLKEIISNWELFKDKDLSYCLLNDKANIIGITNEDLKKIMNSYGIITQLISNNVNMNIYDFINKMNTMSSEEIKEYIKSFTDNILNETFNSISLKNYEYKEIFKYSSFEKYLKFVVKSKSNNASNYELIESLMERREDFNDMTIFDSSFPFNQLLDDKIFNVVAKYGLKNIINFDKKNGNFFTKNNCEMLRKLRILVGAPINEEEFNTMMREMVTRYDLDYKDIDGEFRKNNPDLFLLENAPKELIESFYSKSITPQLLFDYKDYLKNIYNLKFYFKSSSVGEIYNLISSKTDFDNVVKFVKEYSDAFDIIYHKNYVNDEPIVFSTDSINDIKTKLNDALRKNIIKKRVVYPKIIPQGFKEKNPTLFLSDEAPKELQESFYNRTINSEFILSNPIYRNYLKNIDLEVLYNYMSVIVANEQGYNSSVNLISVIKQVFKEESFDVMLLYGKYIESAFKNKGLERIRYNYNFSKEDLLNEIDSNILQTIIDGRMKYDEKMPQHFKEKNPTLFLSYDVPEDIRNKFYNRELILNDFTLNPNLLEIFGATNVAYGFAEKAVWIGSLFNDSKDANEKRLKVISEYFKIKDKTLEDVFKEYVMEEKDNIKMDKIEYVSEVLSRLSLSNSSEIYTFRKELATQILKSSNPLESLSKIEELFIKNNIPTIGKIYSCFEILHPDFDGFNFDSNSMISPFLKKSSVHSKKNIVFSDLIKASFGSNNRSINSYLKNIEIGSSLYEAIKNGYVQYDKLNETEKNELIIFSKHLVTLYNNTMKGKIETDTFKSSGDVLTDILELSKKLSPDGTLDYNLADRVIKMFCGFAGIDTLEEAKKYIEGKVKNADLRNRAASKSDMTLNQGDFIKGIASIIYLGNILQNGSVSREFLGSNADSDLTPLDTDLSMIMSSDGTINDKISSTAAKDYGSIWFVLKNDDRFITTRTGNNGELDIKRDMSKMEAFYTGFAGEGHYGIRTGFASSEINYIVMKNYDPRVGLEIAMNGFYIPIANREGKIIFTPKDYDELRAKMSGLSYFEENNYIFSENLITDETKYFAEQLEQSNFEVQAKREKINGIIKESLEELGLHLKTNIDGDLTEGFVELIDTGSTGRGTNKPGDGDFDFMMRLDKTILSNPTRLNELKQTILRNLGRENSSELTGTGDFRLKGVQIDSDTNVDIDITFTNKTDKVSYSTDMALQDRLATIQRNDPEKYKYVVANILLAKQVLKEAEAYKPNRGEIPQGGLGGVGIENWILQNGGSFIDAAKSFVEAADGKSFSEFQSTYQIWDFGENHLAERRELYEHDNFVTNNMSEAGYQKMVQSLKKYLNNLQIIQNESKGIKI